jgi:hypothetical protein
MAVIVKIGSHASSDSQKLASLPPPIPLRRTWWTAGTPPEPLSTTLALARSPKARPLPTTYVFIITPENTPYSVLIRMYRVRTEY